MLRKLVIKNLAIFEETEISFGDGLIAILGETGAGKSLVVDSLSLLLGSRASSELIRQGSDKAYVSGVFDLYDGTLKEYLKDHDADIGDTVAIERTISKSKSVLKINGILVPVSEFSPFSFELADIHGQLDFASLFNPASYLGLIDAYEEEDIAPLLSSYKEALTEYREMEAKKASWEKRKEAFEEARDYHEAQYSELRGAKLYEGEEESLKAELSSLRDFDKVRSLEERAKGLMDGSSLDALSELEDALKGLSAYRPELSEYASSLSDSRIAIEELLRSVRRSFRETEYDPQRLEELEERDYFISNLKRKYKTDYKGLLDKLNDLTSHLGEDGGFEEEGRTISIEAEKALNEVLKRGKSLSKARSSAAKSLSEELEKGMKELGLNARFEIAFAECGGKEPSLLDDGLDIASFLIETNKGEGLKDLSKVVSGGEASRIMLAYKAVIAKSHRIPTIVFDEADSGISGEAAQNVIRKLLEISSSAQVICITHLPQLAAKAKGAYLISKREKGGRTFASCSPLTKEGLIEEVASLLAGKKASDKELEYAASLVG